MTTLEEVNISVKSAHHRLDTLETDMRDMRELTNAVAITANNVERLQGDITEIKDDVKSLSAMPAKRWEQVIGYVLAALCSGLVGAAIGIVLR